MSNNIFQIKPAVYYGCDSVDLLRQLDYTRALVVTDPFMKKSGMLEQVLGRLKGEDTYLVFAEIRPDPDTALVSAGVKALLEWSPDLVIAFGGGSTIDAAKSILYCAGRVSGHPHIYFVAIPTTSGTGSEVTNFSVITMDGKKVPLIDDSLFPDSAIIDPVFTTSVPPTVTADTGADVLTHALEAYVSTGASNYTDALAEKAVSLIFEYLPTAVKNGADLVVRAQLHDASCMAGMAFTNAGLGINHSLAHALGGAFHVPHGRANAILLPTVISRNARSSEAAHRYAKLAELLGLVPPGAEDGVLRLVTAVRMLFKTIDIPSTLALQGVGRAEFEQKLENLCVTASADSCTATNPIQLTLEDLKDIYLSAYGASVEREEP